LSFVCQSVIARLVHTLGKVSVRTRARCGGLCTRLPKSPVVEVFTLEAIYGETEKKRFHSTLYSRYIQLAVRGPHPAREMSTDPAIKTRSG
jgi:hypothetical protein